MAAKSSATPQKSSLESQLWDAACVLWGHIPATEYRKIIIGLIFLRYVSMAFEKRRREIIDGGDGDFVEDKDAYESENVFFVPEKARWNVVAAASHTQRSGSL